MAWFVDQMGEVVEAVQWTGDNLDEVVEIVNLSYEKSGWKNDPAITKEVVDFISMSTRNPGWWAVLVGCEQIRTMPNKSFWSHYRPHRPPVQEK